MCMLDITQYAVHRFCIHWAKVNVKCFFNTFFQQTLTSVINTHTQFSSIHSKLWQFDEITRLNHF